MAKFSAPDGPPITINLGPKVEMAFNIFTFVVIPLILLTMFILCGLGVIN